MAALPYMSLTVGNRLGPYEIVASIGAGGMGEVYRARDTRLNRDVAIKVLPPEFANDPDRLARFTREAQTLAALNHPNVAAIYGLEGTALVMELLDGETLRDRLLQGALPVRKTIEFAVQIARGLAAAHGNGLVHRDLKPDNIFLLRDGQVKIIDFGLARPAAGVSSGAAETVAAITDPGTVMGTVGYMAPEQVRGHAVDARSDLFAFGAVLYEMLSGQRAFRRDTTAETMTAILKDDPPEIAGTRADISPSLDRITRHCLEKNPVERFQTARDVAFALGALSGSASGVASLAVPSRGRARAAWVAVAGALLLASMAAAAAWYAKPASVMPLRRIELPPDMAGEPTSGVSGSSRPVLSRDGVAVAYFDRGHLWVRRLDALDARDAGAVPADAQALTWSPDGASLAFAAEQTLRTLPASGGRAFVVTKIPASGRLMSIAWLPDGLILMGVWRDGLYAAPATGGEPVKRLAIDPSKEVDFHEIGLAPDQGVILSTHVRGRTDVRIELLRGAERTVLWDGTGVARVAYAAPNMALVQRTSPNTGVWAVPWTGRHLDLASATMVVAGAVWFSAADDNTLLCGVPASVRSQWAWVNRNGTVTAAPGAPESVVSRFALSPDGRRLAFASNKNGKTDIFVRDLATGADRQLTFTTLGTSGIRANPSTADPTNAVESPEWFPAGDRLLYAVAGADAPTLVSQRSDSAVPASPLGPGIIGAVSHDGRTLFALISEPGRAYLNRSAMGAGGRFGAPEPVVAAANDPSIRRFALSRDDRLLAYDSLSPTSRVFVTELPAAQGQVLIDENGREPHFSADGRELFYVRLTTDRDGQTTESLVSVAVVSEHPINVGIPVTIYVAKSGGPTLAEFGVAPDGRRFLFRQPAPPQRGEGAKLIYVENWRAAVKK